MLINDGTTPLFSNPKSISYNTLTSEGTDKDCYLTISAWLILGKRGPLGSLWVSQDGSNWFDICKGIATDFYDNVNGYVSLPFNGFVKKGTRFKYKRNGSDVGYGALRDFVAYEFS